MSTNQSTQTVIASGLQAIASQQTLNSNRIKATLAANASLTAASAGKDATIATLRAQLAAEIAAHTADHTALNNQVLALQAELDSQDVVTAELQAAYDAVKAASDANAALLGGTTPPVIPPVVPPTTDDVAIMAEVTDNTLAGVNKRLGAVGDPSVAMPDVPERALVPTIDSGFNKPYMGNYSEGLVVYTTVKPAPGFDYGSTDGTGACVPRNELVVSADGQSFTGETGLIRIRAEEHSEGQVCEGLVPPWNSASIPDPDSEGHIKYGMKDKLGRVVALARGKINRYDVGVALYDESRGGTGYFGTIGTATARAPWSGTSLPAGKIPLCIAVSSQNEYVAVGVHDRATNKGQVIIYYQWSGNDLLTKESGKGFPFDFQRAMPGLTNSGVIAGTKPFGVFDLPTKWPTSIDFVCSPNTTGDRIEGEDGNAAYLSQWDLSTKTKRDAFMARNGGWISDWGKLAVTSRYDNLVTTLDFTALFSGMKAQYFGTQEDYDKTTYSPDSNGWNAYEYGNPMSFPWGVEAKPEWAPVIKSFNAPVTTNTMLLSEHGDAQILLAGADGIGRFYTYDGQSNGSVAVGANPTSANHSKTDGVRNGGAIITCRKDRKVVVLSGWGQGVTVQETITDKLMIDPVSAEQIDTHGLHAPLIVISDFNGQAFHAYRTGPMVLETQGGAVFQTLGNGIERSPKFAVDGNPFQFSSSNVN